MREHGTKPLHSTQLSRAVTENRGRGRPRMCRSTETRTDTWCKQLVQQLRRMVLGFGGSTGGRSQEERSISDHCGHGAALLRPNHPRPPPSGAQIQQIWMDDVTFFFFYNDISEFRVPSVASRLSASIDCGHPVVRFNYARFNYARSHQLIILEIEGRCSKIKSRESWRKSFYIADTNVIECGDQRVELKGMTTLKQEPPLHAPL